MPSVRPPEPFLRWAGGKRQLVPTLLAALPGDFDLSHHRFFEPFAGGLALTWALGGHASAAGLQATGRKRGLPIVVNDVNVELVTTYQVVRDHVDALVQELEVLGKDTSEARYYEVRGQEPANDLEVAARTIYLNRLAFNGLYRVNGAGGFNVPYGRLVNPVVCDEARLRACAKWLRHIEIRSGSYAAALTDVQAGDVVYLDPPYIPLTTTASFSKYARDDFREIDHWGLAGVIRGVIARGARVVFSNSNTEMTRAIFGEALDLYAVSATRSISASSASRGSVEEVLGLSYDATAASDPGVISALRKETTRRLGRP